MESRWKLSYGLPLDSHSNLSLVILLYYRGLALQHLLFLWLYRNKFLSHYLRTFAILRRLAEGVYVWFSSNLSHFSS